MKYVKSKRIKTGGETEVSYLLQSNLSFRERKKKGIIKQRKTYSRVAAQTTKCFELVNSLDPSTKYTNENPSHLRKRHYKKQTRPKKVGEMYQPGSTCK